jgi:hypothetical protein
MGSMWDRLKPALLMIGVQIVFSACNILYKFAIFDGMSTIVIAAYRLAFATVTTIPLALIFERYVCIGSFCNLLYMSSWIPKFTCFLSFQLN